MDNYIAELGSALPRDFGARYRIRILQEIEGYLLDSAAAGQDAGLSADDALRHAIERCGRPAVIADGFVQVVETRRAQRAHQGLWPLLVICFVLIGLTIWRYPAIVGTTQAIAGALILCAVLLGGYGWFVTVTLGRAQYALWRGARVGLIVGLLGMSTLLLSLLVEMWLWKRSGLPVTSTAALSETLNGWAVGLPALGWVVLTIWEGARRRISLPVCMATGVISGVFTSLVGSISALGLTTLLSAQLAEGVWGHDTTCMLAAAVTRCEMGDTLGGQAIELMLLPLLGMGIAAASQLVWQGCRYVLARRSPGRTAAVVADVTLLRPLTAFTLLLLFVSSCAIVAQFW
jgi:hypothetical protein